jgi:hypothetical protein
MPERIVGTHGRIALALPGATEGQGLVIRNRGPVFVFANFDRTNAMQTLTSQTLISQKLSFCCAFTMMVLSAAGPACAQRGGFARPGYAYSPLPATVCQAGFQDSRGWHDVVCPLRAQQPQNTRCTCAPPANHPHWPDVIGHAVP